MNHIRFLNTNYPVCEKPRSLGHDFVVLDYQDPDTCAMCTSLLFEYNAKSDREELSSAIPTRRAVEELNPIHTFYIGLLLGCVFFLAAILTWRLVS